MITPLEHYSQAELNKFRQFCRYLRDVWGFNIEPTLLDIGTKRVPSLARAASYSDVAVVIDVRPDDPYDQYLSNVIERFTQSRISHWKATKKPGDLEDALSITNEFDIDDGVYSSFSLFPNVNVILPDSGYLRGYDSFSEFEFRTGCWIEDVLLFPEDFV